jgi:hypothetical protein
MMGRHFIFTHVQNLSIISVKFFKKNLSQNMFSQKRREKQNYMENCGNDLSFE